MKKRDELANKFSCLNKAADDEPLFVLRANDPNAPSIVRAWVNAYAFKCGGLDKMDARSINKHNEALQTASDMENWRRLNTTKFP